MAEYVASIIKPRVRHIRAHGDMDTLCGASYFSVARVEQGQHGDGLPVCAGCEKRKSKRGGR